MSDETTPNPSLNEQERRLLALLKSIFIAFRDRNHPPSSPPEKPAWQRFLESTGGTAFISVLVAGIATQVITCSVQTQLKERDTEQAYIKARGEQALVSYKEYLDQEREAVHQAYSQIGSCLSAGQRLIGQTESDWFKKRPGETLEPQRLEIKKNYNEISTKWRTESLGLGLMMSYYHPDGRDVLPNWRKVETAVSEYMDCAKDWNATYSKSPGATAEQVQIACADELVLVNEGLNNLSGALETSRHYPWEGWNSLEDLKKGLANKNVDNERSSQPAASQPSPCPTVKAN